MLEKLDELILAGFTKFSHRFQILFGRTNFLLARCVLILIAAIFSLVALDYWLPQLLTADRYIVEVMIVVWLMSNAFWGIHMLGQIEDHLFSSEIPALSDKLSKIAHLYPSRLITLLAGIFLFVSMAAIYHKGNSVYLAKPLDLLFFTVIFWMGVSEYLIAVVPLPPGRGKVRRWLDGLSVCLKTMPSYNK